MDENRASSEAVPNKDPDRAVRGRAGPPRRSLTPTLVSLVRKDAHANQVRAACTCRMHFMMHLQINQLSTGGDHRDSAGRSPLAATTDER